MIYRNNLLRGIIERVKLMSNVIIIMGFATKFSAPGQ